MPYLQKYYLTILKTTLIVVASISLLVSCRTFETVPNSYIVKGEDNFRSIDEKISIFMGPYSGEHMWDGYKSHLNDSKPSARYTKLFRKLGYDKKTYAVLFTDSYNTQNGIAALINNGVGKDQKLVNLDQLKLKSEDGAKWYQQTKEIGADNVYHAVIPLYGKGIAEKYLSIIKVLPKGESIDSVERFVQQNAKTYQDLGYTLSNMGLPTCAEGVEELYYDYILPEEIHDKQGYFLLKVYKDETNDKGLFFYTLLGPDPIIQGAFKACPGNYKILFTTLDGEVLKSEQIALKNGTKS